LSRKKSNDYLDELVADTKCSRPSIAAYYKAASKGDVPLKYQHGLSNYSQVQLGDDRINFKKSVSQDMYKIDTERANNLKISGSVSASKTLKQRKLDYVEANDLVGVEKIFEMEQMMRDKLHQRTKTGPFQLRKTFKYFDRDGSGGIDFSEFQRAMDLMGFQFTEMQQLALFARYDASCLGEVDYNDFIEKVMESDYKGVQGQNRKAKVKSTAMYFSMNNIKPHHELDDDDSDMDEEEREHFRRTEIRHLFNIIDKDSSGYIDQHEVEELLRMLNHKSDKSVFDEGFVKLVNESGKLDFRNFYAWYTSL